MGIGNSANTWLRSRRWIAAAAIACAAIGTGSVAQANVTGTWTPSALGGSATANGVTVTLTLSAVGAPAPSANTINGTNYWNNPYAGGAINGAPSILFIVPPGGATATITFSKPVDNPVLHVDRLGGSAAGSANSSQWTLTTSGVTMTELAGSNAQFEVVGSQFWRAIGGSSAGGECDGTATGTACGSIRFNGTNITSLTFSVIMIGGAGIGDGVEIAVSIPETNVIVRKQTIDVTAGSFPFAGTNGVGSPALNTGTSNPISSPSYSVTNHANPITISETVPAGYRIDSTSCLDELGATVASTFTGSVTGTGTVNIAAAAYEGGGQTITCTVINKSRSDMSVSLAGLGPATLNTPYTGTYTCTNAASPFLQADAASCAISGLPAGLTSSCSPTPPINVATGGTITCTVSGTPTAAGTVTVTGTTGATNDLNTANNTATASFTVQSSDMTISLSGLPATASIGTPYSGTFTCTNAAAPSVTATNATCAASGLPAGLTTSCTPTPPTNVAPSGTISCTVSGTPTATGTVTVTGTTGATNDSNGGTGTGGNNSATTSIAVTGSDMSVDLSGLPTTASIGVPYAGTIRCTNNSGATASATSASCTTSGLPAGVTIGTCTPTPPATIAAGASISCSVSGTPTAVGTSTVTTTTGATNDTNGGTTTGGNNTSTASVTVTGSDMQPNLSGLPATAEVGVPYSGTVLCTNAATATASATNATCSISGLPPGVTVGTCTPTPPATIAVGASISCPVSGTPTTSGTTTASVMTGATNDTNGGTTAGGNNTATRSVTTSASDMTISLTGLPTSGAIGQPYSGSFTCTNSSSATATAALAACSVSGLPAGLTTSCTPTPPVTLAVGATITCSVTGTPTSAGTSTVNGTTGATNDGNPGNNTATTSIAIGTPSLSITKASTTTSFNAVGVTIPYTFDVRNSGTVTIFSPITVSDSRIASVTCPALTGSGLAPAASITCTGSYVTTQADLDAGGVTNVASATSGTTTSPSTSHTVPATQSPALTVQKTSTTTTFSAAGVSIPYSFRVTNSGNVTLTTAISVSDNKIASVSCPSIGAGLAPGSFITCTGTYTTTQADVDAGGVTNLASATSGTTTSPSTSLTIPATQSPALTVQKTSTTATFSAAGVSIPYSFRITNSGNVTLTSAITVSDNKIASVSCPSIGAGLAPGSFITCTGTYTTTQADIDAGGVTNLAAASSGTTTSPTVNLTIPATQTRSLSVTKSSNPATYSTVGAIISYTYVVRNTGNVTIASPATISVSDNKIPSVSCPALPPAGLAPNATLTCSGSYAISQVDIDNGSVTNTASATDGTVTSPTVSATVTAIQSPSLAILKTSTTTSFNAAGVSIPYSYRVTNNGNVTLTSAITVSDNKIASVTCPSIGSGLAPGSFITCTGAYTTTQADVDAGGVTNVASAQSGTTTSPTATLPINATRTPALTTVKSTTTTSFSAVGVAIPYSYRVTNTGNVTITSAVTVADDKIASVTCPSIGAGLAPGAFITCTGTYTTTQADLDAGGVTNIASATSGATTSPTATVTVPATQTRSLTTAKSSTTASFATVGTIIPYSYRVTNTGNVTLTSAVTVSDNKIPAVSCPALPPAGLAPNAFITCTGNYTVTQADIDAGGVTNIASSTSGTTTSPSVTVTIPSTRSPALTTSKSTTSTSYGTVGATIPYSYRVTNIGNVTLTAAITVTDDKVSSVSCPSLPPGGLAPGAFITCTGSHTVTQADIDAGSLTNIASSTSGTTTSPSVSVTLPAAQTLALSIAKSTTATGYSGTGVVIPYTFVVTNSGNTTLTSPISVIDSKIASVTCPPIGAGLAPGTSMTCTGSYTTTQADVDSGNVVNVASASSGSVTSPAVTHTLTGTQSRALTITKSSTTTAITSAGQVVPYSYVLRNTGNVTLTTAATVTDSKIPSVSCPAFPPGGLLPNATITCTATYTTTQADVDSGNLVNTATAASGTSSGPVTSNTVALTIPVTQSPRLAVVKNSTAPPFTAAGQSISYTYAVTNAGNVTVTSPVTVSDNKIASVSCPALPPAGLAPGASITCTAIYTTTQADVDAGSVTNTATAQSGTTVSPPVSFTLTATQSRSLALAKSASPTTYGTVGATITYTYVVRNTGNTTITTPAAISVSDNKIASVSCPALPPGGLAPNATLTCTAPYTITQADLDAGSVTNIATATDGTVTSPNATATITAIRSPALAIAKNTTTTSFSAVGVVVPYSFRVTNTGNVKLTNPITVSDSKIASVSCPALPPAGLAPNAFITCTGSYTTTQADLDAGSVVNTASATSGTTVAPSTVHTLPATQTRSLVLTKTASPTTYNAPGIAITYTYVVRNTGNITIPASATISVTDDKIASVTCAAMPAAGLAPNATLTCTATYTTTQANVDAGSVTNIASATDGTVTSPTATATISATQTSALTISKSTTATTFATVGQVIPYTFRVTNAGNTTLTTPVTVSDSKIANVTCPALPPGGLAPAAFITCTASYTITQGDIDAGSVVNVASGTSGTVTSPPVTHTLTGTQSPALTIAKSSTATSYSTAGTVIPYSYRVTNSGNTTLTASVTVSDNKIPSVSCPSMPVGGLAPGAFITCTGNYTITQADVDAGSVANVATAASGSVTSPSTTLTITATQSPALAIAKSSTTTTFSSAGTVIPYSFRVTNSGNTTLTAAITVSDNKIASVSCPALPPAGLAPGSFITCTGSYTATQADVDAGGVTNTASARSGTVTSPTVSLTIAAPAAPALSIAKTSTTSSFGAAGIAIPYSYQVTNTGNVTLTNPITVSDNKIATVSCPALPPAGLAPGASITCTGNYTTVQGDVDAGGVTNTASARTGTTTSPTTSLTIVATQAPALTIAKNSTTTSFATSGVVIPYSYRVTNSGNTTLTAPITVSDDKIASVSCPALPPAGLAPGSFITCTGSYTTTQSDVDAGGVTNIATGRSGTLASPSATVTVPSTRSPALTILKSTTATGYAAPGVSIAYSYRVTNSGNTTLTTAITVTDDKIPSVSCPALPPAGLAPGSVITCSGTYTTTQADVDAGSVTNIARATSGTTSSPTSTVTVSATQTPALSVVKSSTATSYNAVGQSVPYSYRVTNTGNVTLTAPISVSDNKIASVSCPALPPAGLAPTAFITCTATYTITQADIDAGSLTNIASARSGTTTSPTATLTITATQAPSLGIAKSSTTTSFNAAGVAITYSYRVTNTGNVTLTQPITVSDNKIASVSCPALPPAGLVPAAYITCTATYTTTQADVDAGQVTNVASATSGTTTSPTATLTIAATQTPALTIAKASTTTSFNTVGTVVPYSYRVTNTGNVTLAQPITVSDNKIASVTCPALPPGGLAPTSFITCSGSYTVTQADLDAGSVTNTASAASGTTTSPTVSLTITATQTPALMIAKSSTTTSFNAVGTVIPYSYRVTNTGNVTLTQPITVSDNKIATVSCPALPVGGLAPAAFITCTASYTTIQADLDAGNVTNVASARSGTTISPTVSLTITATQAPALAVEKTSTVTSFNAVGTVIPYSYKVTNTGNVTLTAAITVTDDKIPSVSCPVLPVGGLAPAAFITCTGTYTTTQADIDTGRITNRATAASGTTTSPTVTLTISGVQQPALTVQKTSTATSFNAVGTVIPYSYRVTNSGNTTLTQPITVTDDKIASVSCLALPPGGLAPGGVITCSGTYTTTQADLDAGAVTNIASAKSGTTTSPSVTLTITGTRTPALSIVKSSTATTYAVAGEGIPYSYRVTNTGNVTLTTAITVTDDKVASVTCPALPVGGLAPATSITCAGNYTVTQADLNAGSLTNTAFARSGTVTSPTVALTITATIRPNFAITKSTGSALAQNQGDGTFTTTFRVTATNTGNIDLTQIRLTDDYASTLPPGAVVIRANFISLASSTRGPLSTGNTAYDARPTSPELIRLPGESLAVGETITADFTITFDPGAYPSGTSFNNTVVGTATLTSGSTTIYSESKNSIAVVTFQPNLPLVVTKVTPRPEISVGGLVPYTITVRNDDTVTRTGISLIDFIPAGFKYRDGTSSVNGVAREPAIAGRQLTWANLTIGPKATLTVKLMLTAGAGLTSGEYTNEAWMIDTSTGLAVSAVATAKVRIVPDATFDCTDIIGKVFDDANRNGYLDEGERGIANVRLVTVNGQIVTTDSEGRYHITCADIPNAFRGSNFVLKLDVRSLPTGYRVTTENPMSMRLTAGKMAKMNFGASIHRVVRIDVMDAAYESGTAALRAHWAQAVGAMIPSLKVQHAVLRIAYRRGTAEDKALAIERVRALEALVRDAWRKQNGKDELPIESEIYLDQPKAQKQSQNPQPKPAPPPKRQP